MKGCACSNRVTPGGFRRDHRSPSIVIERRRVPPRSLLEKENAMTFIEPDSPGGEPEIMPPETPAPDIDPSDTPEEMPQQDPDGGGPGDARPYGGR